MSPKTNVWKYVCWTNDVCVLVGKLSLYVGKRILIVPQPAMF